MGGRFGAQGDGPQMSADEQQAQYMAKMVCMPILLSDARQHTDAFLQMNTALETCPTKAALAGVMGFGLGGMFGLFMSSVSTLPLPRDPTAGLPHALFRCGTILPSPQPPPPSQRYPCANSSPPV